MRIYNNKVSIIYNIFEYFLAFALVLNCRTIWNYIPSMEHFFNFVFYFTIFSVFGCILAKKMICSINVWKSILACIIMVVYFSLYLLITEYNQIGFLKYMIIFITLIIYYYCCCDEQDFPSVLYKYSNIIIFISIISIFLWMFGSQMHVLSPSDYIYSTWSDTGQAKLVSSYYGLYYETQTMPFLGLENFIRNTAIFTEAPMASFNFSIALVIELFFKKEVKRSRYLILIFAILTTASTTGCIAIIGSLYFMFLKLDSNDRLITAIKLILIPITCLICFIGIYWITMKKLDSGSGSIRIDDFIVGYKAWKQNPLFGGGYNNEDYIKSFMGAWRNYNTGFSNSIMQILAQGGIYLTSLYVLCFGKGIRASLIKKNKDSFYGITIIIFVFAITVVTYQYLMIILLIFFVNMKDKKIEI